MGRRAKALVSSMSTAVDSQAIISLFVNLADPHAIVPAAPREARYEQKSQQRTDFEAEPTESGAYRCPLDFGYRRNRPLRRPGRARLLGRLAAVGIDDDEDRAKGCDRHARNFHSLVL